MDVAAINKYTISKYTGKDSVLNDVVRQSKTFRQKCLSVNAMQTLNSKYLNFDKQIVNFDSICLSSTSKNRSLKSFSTLVLKHLGKYLLKKS